MASKSAVAPTEPIVAEIVAPTELGLFDSLVADAAVLDTPDVFDKEAKRKLIGVPFVITGGVFRVGDQSQYVSLEAVTGPNDNGIAPNRRIVVNDGSTGAFRQFASYCESLGLITLPEGKMTGKRNESRFETRYTEWEFPPGTVETGGEVEVTFDEDGDPTIYIRLTRPWLCRNGLRQSTYDGGETFYLA